MSVYMSVCNMYVFNLKIIQIHNGTYLIKHDTLNTCVYLRAILNFQKKKKIKQFKESNFTKVKRSGENVKKK